MLKILLTLLIAAIFSQIIKLLIFFYKHREPLHLKDLFVTGGMPSSHSALVTSLALIILLQEGLSTSFCLALALAVIVLRDAYGVRRTAGEEGRLLNQILKKLKIKIPHPHFALGHTPLEVTIGSLIGIVVALVVYFV